MLQKKYRFHRRNTVNYVQRAGTAVRMRGMTVRYVRRDKGQARVAVVVSKKVAKNAVTRNRIRRRIFAAAQLLDCEAHSVDVVVQVYTAAYETVVSDTLKGDLSQGFKKAGLL